MSKAPNKTALIIGGNRFFGKKLAANLLANGYLVTLMNRGNSQDDFGPQVERIVCDRTNPTAMQECVKGRYWDYVFDQVCYEFDQARQACEVFKGKVGKYIFTSSESVYDAGSSLKEDDFDTANYSFTERHTADSNYQEAKRQAEKGFFEEATFPVAFARMCIVLGLDDYTERMKFHVDQTLKGDSIYFSNLDARLSMINSDQAAQALQAIAESDLTGAVNVSCSEPILIKDFVRYVEEATGEQVKLATEMYEGNRSPYGIRSDWYMDTQKLTQAMGSMEPIESWLPEMLREVQKQ